MAEIRRLVAASTDALDRDGLAKHLVQRMRKADKMATAYRRRSLALIESGVVKLGPEGPVEADSDAAAVRWAALSEQAAGRGDKIARALFSIVSDTERRQDLARREELAAAVLGKSNTKRAAA